MDSEIYQPAKFHRSTPTDTRDIRYQNSCGQKNKQTVNDISPTCLSACVDNKQTVNDISPTCLSACGDNKLVLYLVLAICVALPYKVQHWTRFFTAWLAITGAVLITTRDVSNTTRNHSRPQGTALMTCQIPYRTTRDCTQGIPTISGQSKSLQSKSG